MNSPIDYFRYRASTPAVAPWGAVVTGSGRFTARPGRPYPPPGHPVDHAFTWARGRVLGAFQLVYVAEGGGEFETRATGSVRVEAGTALLLFPGVWHRYRPDARTGWVEQWVEIAGSLLEGLLRAGEFAPEHSIVRVTRRLELETRLAALQALTLSRPAGSPPELAAQAVGLLALLAVARHEVSHARPVTVAVEAAKRAMEESVHPPIAMPALARSLGVAYSHFRREFKRRTGISPRQYLLHLRMQRVQRLLGASDETLKELADRFGFSSPFHLSAAFKKEFGVSPTHWRRRLQR